MNLLSKSLLAFSASLFVGQAPARAATYICGGTVETVGQSDNGYVYVGVGNLGPFWICNVAATHQGISPDTCRSWLSQAVASYSLRKTINFYFNSSYSSNASFPANCSNPSDFSWNERLPYFVNLLN